MAENKKISQLNPAVAFTGAEKFEILQGGLNLCGTPEQMKEYVGAGPTREFNRAFSSELLFDKNEIEYAEEELSTDLEYTVADSGHISNQFSSAVQRIKTDGTRTVTFTGFNFVLGDIQSGSIPEAGTYLVLFLYWNGVATVNWTKPSLEAANLIPLSTPANFAANPGAGDPETEIDLTWDAVTNASSYEIYVSTTGGSGPWGTPIATPASGSTSYTHTGRTPNTTYHYRIRAIGDLVVFSNSVYSTDATTTEDSGDITAPTFTFSPVDAATDIPMNGAMVITASAPLRDQDGVTEITDANLSDYITAVNSSAAAQPFTATIDATKTIITVTPNVVWTELDDITITIDGVESSVNGVHAVADDATFTTSDYTQNAANNLNFGDLADMDALFSANDTNFEFEITILDPTASGTRTFVSKWNSSIGGVHWYSSNGDFLFSFANYAEPGMSRRIKWTGALAAGKWKLKYDGSIDTNNGLDRLILEKDDVAVGSKTMDFASGTMKPIAANSDPLKSGPSFAKVKDLFIRSNNGATVELSVPVIRTGEDTSGNNRDGTWV